MVEPSPTRYICHCRACGRKSPQLIGTCPEGTWCECPACRRIWHCDVCPRIGRGAVSDAAVRAFREHGTSWIWSV